MNEANSLDVPGCLYSGIIRGQPKAVRTLNARLSYLATYVLYTLLIACFKLLSGSLYMTMPFNYNGTATIACTVAALLYVRTGAI